MPIGFIRSLFADKSPADPTIGWPELEVATPVVNLQGRQIGALRFGAPLEQARGFGRPDSCGYTSPGYLEMIYARAGFRIDFEKNLLAYAAFFVGPDEFDPSLRNLNHCSPRESAGVQFSARTTKADLIRVLGQPISIDSFDADDVIVNFSRNGLTLEFELNATGHLKRWNLYPEMGGSQ